MLDCVIACNSHIRRDSYYEALAIYGNRRQYAAEITWTSFLYSDVVEMLQEPRAPEARVAADHELVEFSLKIGRKVKKEDLEDFLPPWAL